MATIFLTNAEISGSTDFPSVFNYEDGASADFLTFLGGGVLEITANENVLTLVPVRLTPLGGPPIVLSLTGLNQNNDNWTGVQASGSIDGYNGFTFDSNNPGEIAINWAGNPLIGNSGTLSFIFEGGGAAVPEPSSLALVSLGGLGLLLRRRRA